jgi:hypothetical protein
LMLLLSGGLPSAARETSSYLIVAVRSDHFYDWRDKRTRYKATYRPA